MVEYLNHLDFISEGGSSLIGGWVIIGWVLRVWAVRVLQGVAMGFGIDSWERL